MLGEEIEMQEGKMEECLLNEENKRRRRRVLKKKNIHRESFGEISKKKNSEGVSDFQKKEEEIQRG